MKDEKHFADHYAAGKHPQPVTVLSSEPSKAYYLSWARYIYAMFCGGAAQTRPDNFYKVRGIGELRSYARGEQPVSKYRAMIDVCVKDGKVGNTTLEASAGSLLNISMDNIRVYPKYRDLGISKISQEEYEPVVRAMDDESSFQRRKEFYLGKLATDPRMQQLASQAGVVPEAMKKYQGMSQNDIETTSQMGGIQLAAESLIADVVGTTMDLSEWSVLKAMLVSDLWDVNYAAVKVHCTNTSLRLEYVDAAGLIFPASKEPDHRHDQYVASVRKTNIATLRADYGLSEKELYTIAKAFGGRHNNNASLIRGFNERAFREDFAASNGYQVYDHFMIDVMDFYFIASKTEDMLVGIYQDPTAESRVDQIGGTAYSEDKVACQYTYGGCWVVGSEIVFGEGMQPGQVRTGEDGRKCAALPIRIWSGDGASITERCISVIDDFQMAVLKTRLLIANLPPGPRFLMDMSVLENAVQFGKDSYDMKDMLTIFGATGKLLIRSKSEFDTGGASQKSPIIPIDSGIQEDFAILANVMASSIDMIRQSTGMNEIADGTGNPGDVLNGVAKGFQAASNNALQPLSLAMSSLHTQVYNTLAKKYQAMRLYSPVSVKKWHLDASHFTVLNLPSDIPMYDFHIKARLLPSQEELQSVLNSLLQKEAEGIVTGADSLIVMQMIRDRDVVKARVYLGRAIAAAKEQEYQKQVQLIKEQAQANAQSAAASEEARRKTEMAKGEVDAKLLGIKDEYDMKKGLRENGWKLEQIEAEGVALQKVEIVKNAAVNENIANVA